MILADKIIGLRKRFGWSQEELAEKMNVSRQSVSKWESTNSIPDINKIIMLAKMFNVSTDFLLKDEVEEFDSVTGSTGPDIIQISLEQALKYVENKMEVTSFVTKGDFTLSMLSNTAIFLFSNGCNKSIGSNK